MASITPARTPLNLISRKMVPRAVSKSTPIVHQLIPSGRDCSPKNARFSTYSAKVVESIASKFPRNVTGSDETRLFVCLARGTTCLEADNCKQQVRDVLDSAFAGSQAQPKKLYWVDESPLGPRNPGFAVVVRDNLDGAVDQIKDLVATSASMTGAFRFRNKEREDAAKPPVYGSMKPVVSARYLTPLKEAVESEVTSSEPAPTEPSTSTDSLDSLLKASGAMAEDVPVETYKDQILSGRKTGYEVEDYWRSCGAFIETPPPGTFESVWKESMFSALTQTRSFSTNSQRPFHTTSTKAKSIAAHGATSSQTSNEPTEDIDPGNYLTGASKLSLSDAAFLLVSGALAIWVGKQVKDEVKDVVWPKLKAKAKKVKEAKEKVEG